MERDEEIASSISAELAIRETPFIIERSTRRGKDVLSVSNMIFGFFRAMLFTLGLGLCGGGLCGSGDQFDDP